MKICSKEQGIDVMRLLVFVLVTSTILAHTVAKSSDAGPMQYPKAIPAGELKWNAGLALGKVPKDIVEEMDTFRWPLLELDAFIGLPKNFLVEATLNTQVITNHIRIGPKWVVNSQTVADVLDSQPSQDPNSPLASVDGMPLHRISAMFGIDGAFMFGFMRSGAFDNTVNAVFLYPNASLGYRFENVTITAKGELNFLMSYKLTAESVVTSSRNAMFNGGSIALYLEQPLWKDQYLQLGFKQNFVQFYYPSWLLFPTFDRYYWVPEFVIGFRL